MLELLGDSVRKVLVVPAVPISLVWSAGVILSFLVLLLKNQIHPLVVFLLQLYLSF